jgi:GNAT superfamily N-acetyltransferase
MTQIIPATLQNIKTIQAIAFATWPTTYGAIISAAQINYMLQLMYSEDALEQQMASGHQFYLAEINNTPIGFASISIETEAENTFKLNKLYVLPSSQNTGAGKALLLQVLNYAREKNGTQLILQVNKYNKAKAFYERYGFSILSEHIVELDHGFIMDDYIMGIQL